MLQFRRAMTGQKARGEEGKQEEETPVPLSIPQFAAICDLESAVVNFLVSWGNRTDHKGSVGRSHARIRAEIDQLAVVVSGISGR